MGEAFQGGIDPFFTDDFPVLNADNAKAALPFNLETPGGKDCALRRDIDIGAKDIVRKAVDQIHLEDKGPVVLKAHFEDRDVEDLRVSTVRIISRHELAPQGFPLAPHKEGMDRAILLLTQTHAGRAGNEDL